MTHDKLIHKDEFRLRVLLTNQCDRSCSFCLNDFQPKEPKQYAMFFDVQDCLRAYGSFMAKHSIVTFSGGEPGIYPGLSTVLKTAKYYCSIVKVVTNGTAFHPDYVPFVDKWHIGVVHRSKSVLNMLRHTKDISVQFVVTDAISTEYLIDLVDFYRREGILVKLFVDFFSKDKSKLQIRVQHVMDHFKDGICTRFTGKQINRGLACAGCEKECVTLKALWYFPDGSSSTCPQGMVKKYDDDSWDETVEKAYQAHLYKNGS